MDPELSKSMPMGQVEQKLENKGIVKFRYKTIKNRYSALDEHSKIS